MLMAKKPHFRWNLICSLKILRLQKSFFLKVLINLQIQDGKNLDLHII